MTTYWRHDVYGQTVYMSAERSAEIIETHLQARCEAQLKGRDLPNLPIQHVQQTPTSASPKNRDGKPTESSLLSSRQSSRYQTKAKR